MVSEEYDALTLEIERADVLAAYLVGKLSNRSEDQDLYAFSLIAEKIRQSHALMYEKAKALLEESQPPAQCVCGWCRIELAPGRQPATHGICAACNVKLSLQAERRHGGAR